MFRCKPAFCQDNYYDFSHVFDILAGFIINKNQNENCSQLPKIVDMYELIKDNCSLIVFLFDKNIGVKRNHSRDKIANGITIRIGGCSMGRILFQLTPEIIDLIIFGMENQSDRYYVNINTGVVLSDVQTGKCSEGERLLLIPLPEWLSADGFQLMEGFVALVHNPIHKEVLRRVLSAGKGAFRNFKNAVKDDDSLTAQWFHHKERVMRLRVIEWYNLNSEIIKYSSIDENTEENTDETENLILTDFVFNTNYSFWKDLIAQKSAEAIRESLGDDYLLAEYLLCKYKSFAENPENTPVFVCAETVVGEYAGHIGGSIIKTECSGHIFAVSNIIWVEKKFRGMGLARHLVDLFTQNANSKSCEKLIFELPGSGSVLNSTLETRGASAFLTTMEVSVQRL